VFVLKNKWQFAIYFLFLSKLRIELLLASKYFYARISQTMCNKQDKDGQRRHQLD